MASQVVTWALPWVTEGAMTWDKEGEDLCPETVRSNLSYDPGLCLVNLTWTLVKSTCHRTPMVWQPHVSQHAPNLTNVLNDSMSLHALSIDHVQIGEITSHTFSHDTQFDSTRVIMSKYFLESPIFWLDASKYAHYMILIVLTKIAYQAYCIAPILMEQVSNMTPILIEIRMRWDQRDWIILKPTNEMMSSLMKHMNNKLIIWGLHVVRCKYSPTWYESLDPSRSQSFFQASEHRGCVYRMLSFTSSCMHPALHHACLLVGKASGMQDNMQSGQWRWYMLNV